MRRRKPAASTPAAPLRPPPLPRCSSSLPPGGVVEPVPGRTPSPSRPPPNPAASASARGPETGDPEIEGTAHREMVTAPHPPPEEGRVENLLFNLVFVPPLAQQPAVPKTSIKEQFPQSLGLKRRRVVYRASRDHFPPLSPGSEWVVAQEHPSCPFVEPGNGSSTHVPASSRHTPSCHKPQAGLLCFQPHEEESGERYTTHPDPAPCHHRPRAGSLCSTSLPHHGYVGGPLVPLARSLGAWLALPSPSQWHLRAIRLGYAIQFARRPPKFRGIRFTSVKAADAPVLHAEIAVLLAKDVIEPVPPARGLHT